MIRFQGRKQGEQGTADTAASEHALDCRKKREERYVRFAELYRKFVAGGRWLDQQKAAGKDVAKDTREFVEQVDAPLDALWRSFTPEEQKALEGVMRAYDATGGKRMVFVSKAEQGDLALKEAS